MTLKIIESEQHENETVFLQDGEMEYVSLVPKGANKTPFAVIKNNGEVGGMPENRMTVQSLVLPKSIGWDEFVAAGNTWLEGIQPVAKRGIGNYVSHVLIEKENFEDVPPMGTKKLSVGGFMLFGKLPDEKRGVVKGQVIELPPVGTSQSIQELENKASLTIGDVVLEDLRRLQDILIGALNQRGLDPKARLIIAKKAIQGFDKSITDILSKMSSASVKTEEKGITDETRIFTEGADMFTTKQDLEAFITETVTTILKSQSKAAPKTEEDGKSEKMDTGGTSDSVTTLTQTIEKQALEIDKISASLLALNDQITGLVEKQGTLATDQKTLTEKHEALLHHSVSGTSPGPDTQADTKKDETAAGSWAGVW